LRDPALVAAQVAEAIGVPEHPGRSIVDTLVDALGASKLSIVLDNCEHLVDASAALVETLLRRCPGAHVLATSREPLGVEGEHLYRLVPLATPLTGPGILAEEVGKFDAVQLFVERAAAQRPGFTLDDTNASAVAAVCQHLDGIPLAIELAAARLRSMSVFDIESNLADRFGLLTGGRRTALPRHRTLKAMIDWSYEMLGTAEQAVLCRLSPFAGGWRLDAAKQVCAGGVVAPAEVSDLLGGLVDKSLIEVEPTGWATRYRLLETIRQYAAGRLADSREADQIARAHALAYLDLAERAGPYLRGHDQLEWAARIDEDIDNIRTAGATLLAVRDGAEEALRLVVAQRWYWDIRSRYQEGLELAQAALQKADQLPPSVMWARALLVLVWMKSFIGNLQLEQERIDEALAVARAHGDTATVSDLLIVKVITLYSHGQRGPDVVAMAHESIELARRTGDAHVIGRALAVCSSANETHDIALALSLTEEAVSVFRAAGDHYWLGAALGNLANIETSAGDFTKARSHLEEATSIVSRVVGDSSLLGVLFVNSGTDAVLQREPGTAEVSFREAFNMAARVGVRDVEAWSVLGLAWCASAAGDWHRAASLHGIAQALLEQLGHEYRSRLARAVQDDLRKLREEVGADAYEEAFGPGQQLAETWWRTDRLSRAAAIFPSGTPG